MQFVYPISQVKRYRFPTHINDLVMDRSEAQTSEAFVVVIEPGKAPPLHQHADTEQIFYILEGEGFLKTAASEKEEAVRPGDLIRIPPKTLHSIRCFGKQPLRYLAIDCFVGGRPVAEPTWDSHVQVLCREQGWNYRQVVRPEPA